MGENFFHMSVKSVSRGAGKSVVASAAYRSGEKLQDNYYGLTHDYTKKQNVVSAEILLPLNAPCEYVDRQTLWNEVEKSEKAKNAQLAREIEIAIPREVTPDCYKDFVRRFCKENFVDNGMCADICIHDKKDGNPHAHIMLTLRAINEDGTWAPKSKKEYILDKDGNKIYDKKKRQYKCRKINTTDWNTKEKLENWRENYAKYCNDYLEKANSQRRVDHRSFERQGIDLIPTIHMGSEVFNMEKKGISTDIGTYNKKVKTYNTKLIYIRNVIKGLIEKIKSIPEKTDIEIEAELLEQYETALKKCRDIRSEYKVISNKIRHIKDNVIFAENYRKYKGYYKAYRNAKKPEDFKEKYRMEVTLAETAIRILKSNYNGKIPTVQSIKTEQLRLKAKEKYIAEALEKAHEELNTCEKTLTEFREKNAPVKEKHVNVKRDTPEL